jgi:indolepyruvate ferredoxin oxidoreductase alpha subunit
MRHAGVEDTIFAVIGDSTFFHAGMPGLLNIAYNDAKVCVVILDNQVVAMTGHQPTPESGRRVTGEEAKVIGIDGVAKALGIGRVEIVDPYDLEETQRVIKEILKYDGPSVIVSRRPCVLMVKKGTLRRVGDACTSCGVCVKVLGCPAISLGEEGAEIDSTLCRGCGVCESICPSDEIGV